MPINADNSQNDNQNQPQDQQSQPITLGGSGGNTGRTAAFSSGAQPGQKGSGRYTNLQKYIGANQGAGERLASGITGKIGQETEKNKKEADTQTSNVRAGIESANQNLQRGQGYQQQLGSEGFNAQQFVADDNQLQDFSKFRTNQAIDQSGLQNQYNQALTATQNAQQALQNRQQQAATEAGRFNLLKETFGGRGQAKPNYSTGQQRLDQLFLQSGGANNVGQIQNQLRSQGNVLNQNLNTLQNDLNTNLQNVGTQSQELAKALQDKTGQMETGYITGLENKIGSVNEARNQQRANYEKFINQLAGKVTGEELDPNLIKEFDLMQNQQMFNVPKNLNTYRDVVNVSDAQAQNYKDVATQEDVNQYRALAKLAGIGNDKLSQASTLAAAAQAKTGEDSLQNRIQQQKQNILNKAAGTEVSGYGKTDNRHELTMNANLANFLNNSSGNLATDIANNAQIGSYASYNNNGFNLPTKTAADQALYASALDNLANLGYFDVLGSTGGMQGSQNLADYREGGVYAPKKLI